MAINEADFVKINYIGTVEGEVFDTTNEEKAREVGIHSENKSYEPIVIRVGGMHVIPGLDEDLIGKEIGTEYNVEIPAEKAYGPVDESLIRSASTKDFNEKPTVGTRVSSEGREGVVVNVVGKRVVIDFNHPLAGKTLNYSYTIEGVVEDTEEKAKAIFKLFSGKDMEMAFTDGVLTVILPPGVSFDKRWMMGKGMSVHQIFEYIEGVEDIELKESFKRPAKVEEEVEEVEEAEEALEEDLEE